jgi:hypothetical protein
MLLIPLAKCELLPQGGILQGQAVPGQECRPDQGDESRYQCSHEVAEHVIKGDNLMLEVIYGVFTEHDTRLRGPAELFKVP